MALNTVNISIGKCVSERQHISCVEKLQLYELEICDNYMDKSLLMQDTYYQITPLKNERENQYNSAKHKSVRKHNNLFKEFAKPSGKF